MSLRSVCVLLLFASQVQAAEFIPLGFFGPGAYPPASMAYGVDATGSRVVGTSVFDGKLTAFLWQPETGMEFIPGAVDTIVANSISADGTTLVGRARTDATPVGESFIWRQDTGFTVLGGITPSSTGNLADDVSADGRVVIGTTSTPTATWEAFRWMPEDGFLALGDLGGDTSVSTALAVSHDGNTVVGQSSSINGPEAFRWTADEGIVGLGDLPGRSFNSVASEVSGDGRIVVGSSSSLLAAEEAFRWSEEFGMQGLGFLPTASDSKRSLALGVSGDGDVVIGTSGELNELTAFVWDSIHGMRSLQKVLEIDLGLAQDLAGWQLAWAQDISPDGLSIVGWGYNPAGNQEAWLVRLDRPIFVPEPSTAFLAALSLAGMLCYHRPRCV